VIARFAAGAAWRLAPWFLAPWFLAPWFLAFAPTQTRPHARSRRTRRTVATLGEHLPGFACVRCRPGPKAARQTIALARGTRILRHEAKRVSTSAHPAA